MAFQMDQSNDVEVAPLLNKEADLRHDGSQWSPHACLQRSEEVTFQTSKHINNVVIHELAKLIYGAQLGKISSTRSMLALRMPKPFAMLWHAQLDKRVHGRGHRQVPSSESSKSISLSRCLVFPTSASSFHPSKWNRVMMLKLLVEERKMSISDTTVSMATTCTHAYEYQKHGEREP